MTQTNLFYYEISLCTGLFTVDRVRPVVCSARSVFGPLCNHVLQVTRVSLRQKYPDVEDQITCVLSSLLMSGEIYEIEPGVFGLV